MSRDETRWSKDWIKNFKKQCSEKGIYVKTLNVHGHSMQERGVSDYLICYEGRYIAIEFKTVQGKPTSYQQNFLDEVYYAGGVALVVYLAKTYFFIECIPHEVNSTHTTGDTEKAALDKILKIF